MNTCLLRLEFIPLKSLVANFCPSTRYKNNTQVFISLEGVALCWNCSACVEGTAYSDSEEFHGSLREQDTKAVKRQVLVLPSFSGKRAVPHYLGTDCLMLT